MQAVRQPSLAWDDDLTHLWESPPAEAAEAPPREVPPARPARQPRTAAPGAGAGWLRPLMLAAVGLTMLAAVAAGVDWARVRLDDLRYGRPRTTHLTAFVGHGEVDGLPTHLMAMNLNRRITIMELPGGDPTKIRTIAGPYLVGKDEELTVATLRLLDVNGDSHPDLLLRVKNEELVYINERGEFRLMTRSERPMVERALEASK